jgi:hypothetical protein
MVTVKHAAATMHLSDQNWKQVEIQNGLNKQSIAARIQHFAGTRAEKIAVLELQIAFSSAQGFSAPDGPTRSQPIRRS